MNNPEAFENLIKLRQQCTKCHSADNLRHFEKLLDVDLHSNLFSPWNPIEKNDFDAEILVIGQDFGTFQYLQSAKNIEGLKSKECKNSTNKKLTTYLESTGLLNRKIYFTNAILCIKNGESKNTKSGTSMSSKVEIDWFKNCSSKFLKPLITDHLPNLKIIITLGKNALFSVNNIIDHKAQIIDNNIEMSLIDLVAIKQKVLISNKPYTLIPMLHPSFDHLSSKGHKQGKKAKELWKDLNSLLTDIS